MKSLLFLVMGCLAVAQAVPDAILYQTVFLRVQMQKEFAAHVRESCASKDARLCNDSAARVQLQKEMGLTDDEYARLETIAAQAQAAQDQYFKRREEILKTPVSEARRRQYAENERSSPVGSEDHITRLRNALGEASFQKVNAWARREILPHIGWSSLKPEGARP